jgi:hypothetical protein
MVVNDYFEISKIKNNEQLGTVPNYEILPMRARLGGRLTRSATRPRDNRGTERALVLVSAVDMR